MEIKKGFYDEMNLINEKYDSLKTNECENKLKSFWKQVVMAIFFIGVWLFFFILSFVVPFLFIFMLISLMSYLINSLVLSIRILANDYGYLKVESMKKLWGLLSLLLLLPSLLFQIIFIVKGRRIIKFYKSNKTEL